MPSLAEAFIFDAIRTPLGRGKSTGKLHTQTPLRLVSSLLRELRRRYPPVAQVTDDLNLGGHVPLPGGTKHWFQAGQQPGRLRHSVHQGTPQGRGMLRCLLTALIFGTAPAWFATRRAPPVFGIFSSPSHSTRNQLL